MSYDQEWYHRTSVMLSSRKTVHERQDCPQLLLSEKATRSVHVDIVKHAQWEVCTMCIEYNNEMAKL